MNDQKIPEQILKTGLEKQKQIVPQLQRPYTITVHIVKYKGQSWFAKYWLIHEGGSTDYRPLLWRYYLTNSKFVIQ